MKNLIYILIFIPLICIGQTISINGSLHSTNGDNTFPIWVEEGTTIQPNYPVKSISIKEFNVVPNSNGNDLVFNKTVLVYSDSVSTVPEDKTWKLESIQNGLQIGDEYAGGIIFYLDGNGGGKVFADSEFYYSDWFGVSNFCNDLNYNNYQDWYMPNETELRIIANYLSHNKSAFSSDGGLDVWSSSSTSNGNYVYLNVHRPSWRGASGTSSDYGVIPIRQF